MARYTGPATRKSRRLGVDLVGGDQSFEKRPYPPGQHGRAHFVTLDLDWHEGQLKADARLLDVTEEVVPAVGRRASQHANSQRRDRQRQFAIAIGELPATIMVLPPQQSTALSVRVFQLLHYGVDDRVAAICLVMVLFVGLTTAVAAALLNRSS